MPFNNPIPRTGMPHFHESSPLRSLRDSDSTGRQWLRNKTISKQSQWSSESIRNIQWQLNRLRLRVGGGDVAIPTTTVSRHPCKIYNSPRGGFDIASVASGSTVVLAKKNQVLIDYFAEVGASVIQITGAGIPAGAKVFSLSGTDSRTITLSVTPITATTTSVTLDLPWWRIVRVRAFKFGGIDVTGTDGDLTDSDGKSPNLDPDRRGTPAFDASGANPVDFLVPSSETFPLYYVWMDITAPASPFVDAGQERPGSIADDTGWVGSDFCWIGSVDAWTLLSTSKLIVRQIRRADIPVIIGCKDGVTTNLPC